MEGRHDPERRSERHEARRRQPDTVAVPPPAEEVLDEPGDGDVGGDLRELDAPVEREADRVQHAAGRGHPREERREVGPAVERIAVHVAVDVQRIVRERLVDDVDRVDVVAQAVGLEGEHHASDEPHGEHAPEQLPCARRHRANLTARVCVCAEVCYRVRVGICVTQEGYAVIYRGG